MNVFTYGTLSVPEVMLRVTGRQFSSRPAVLQDHVRYLVRDQWFPGIVPHEGHSVEGVLHQDVDEASLARLDEFESEMYLRGSLPVFPGSSTGTTAPPSFVEGEAMEPVLAEVYVVAPTYEGLLTDVAWDEAHFRSHWLQRYLSW